MARQPAQGSSAQPPTPPIGPERACEICASRWKASPGRAFGRSPHWTALDCQSLVYFAPAADQGAVERPPIVHYQYYSPLPMVAAVCAGVPVLVLIAGVVLWRWLRRPAG